MKTTLRLAPWSGYTASDHPDQGSLYDELGQVATEGYMKALFAGLQSPGLLLPLVNIATQMRERDHDVAFVCSADDEQTLDHFGFLRIPRTRADGASFGIKDWFKPESIALQVKHLAFALDTYRADVIVANHLSLGAIVCKQMTGIPVVLLGPLIYLWPSSLNASSGERVPHWRQNDMIEHLKRARALIGLENISRYDELSEDLLGDAYLLQGVPEMQPPGALPNKVTCIGSCWFDDQTEMIGDDDIRWLRDCQFRNIPILYVQIGRVFQESTFWLALDTWASTRKVAIIVCQERHMQQPIISSSNIRVRTKLSQGEILPYASGVICGGHPTAMLGAAQYGLSTLVMYNGSGTEDVAGFVDRFGNGKALQWTSATKAEIMLGLDNLLDDHEQKRKAISLQRSLAAFDGPALACEIIEDAMRSSATC